MHVAAQLEAHAASCKSTYRPQADRRHAPTLPLRVAPRLAPQLAAACAATCAPPSATVKCTTCKNDLVREWPAVCQVAPWLATRPACVGA
eukprot:1156438-Alexandrium_andersonii.AAC.1